MTGTGTLWYCGKPLSTNESRFRRSPTERVHEDYAALGLPDVRQEGARDAHGAEHVGLHLPVPVLVVMAQLAQKTTRGVRVESTVIILYPDILIDKSNF